MGRGISCRVGESVGQPTSGSKNGKRNRSCSAPVLAGDMPEDEGKWWLRLVPMTGWLGWATGRQQRRRIAVRVAASRTNGIKTDATFQGSRASVRSMFSEAQATTAVISSKRLQLVPRALGAGWPSVEKVGNTACRIGILQEYSLNPRGPESCNAYPRSKAQDRWDREIRTAPAEGHYARPNGRNGSSRPTQIKLTCR